MPGSGPHLDPSLRSPHPPGSLQTRMWCPWRQRIDPTSSSMSQPMGLWSWPSGRAALPSTTMPPSYCTGGQGRQASWPWSRWQSPAPSFTCRAPRWACSYTSTRRCSAGARSSAFWVGVHPAVTRSPSSNRPSCPLPPSQLPSRGRIPTVLTRGGHTLVPPLRWEGARPPCRRPRELWAVGLGAQPASWVLPTPTGQLHGLKIGQPLWTRGKKCS